MSDIKEIAFTKTKLSFGWLGNMAPYPVTDEDGLQWRTTEALFQAMRFAKDDPIREEIRAEKSPMGAKLKAKGNSDKMIVKQLSKEDVHNMEYCVRLKIEQHPILKDLLIDSGDLPIYEDVTKRGRKGSNLFWGALKHEDGTWEGYNILGELWMTIRGELTTPLEIERRFLLKKIPKVEFNTATVIRQGYMTEKDNGKTERARVTEDYKTEYFYTPKTPITNMSAREWEEEISEEKFKEYEANFLREIRKVRYYKSDNDLTWEIDEYDDISLVIAEIELPSEDYDLQIPEWLEPYIIMEITEFKEFSNSNLAE
jgi:CYTH domain-containing protein